MNVYLNNPILAKVLLVLGAMACAVLSATVLKGTDMQPVFSHAAMGLLTTSMVQIQHAAAKEAIQKASVRPPP